MIKMGLTELLSQINDYKSKTSITNIYFNIHYYRSLIIFGKAYTLDFNRIILDTHNSINIFFNFINFAIKNYNAQKFYVITIEKIATFDSNQYVEFIYAVNEV
jgi:hypothetical protein